MCQEEEEEKEGADEEEAARARVHTWTRGKVGSPGQWDSK